MMLYHWVGAFLQWLTTRSKNLFDLARADNPVFWLNFDVDASLQNAESPGPMNLSPIVWKTIFRAHYKPKLRYFSAYTNIAEKLEGYPDWEVDGTKVTLHDWSKRRSVMIEHNSFGVEQDSGNPATETESIDQLLKTVPEVVGIREFARLGFRRKYLVDVGMSFDSLLAIINTRILRPEVSQIFPPATDCVYRYDSVEKDTGYHIWIAPVKRGEMIRALEFNHHHHLNPKDKIKDFEKLQQSYPETALLIDVDYCQTEVKKEQAINFILKARQELEKLANGFVAYCFSDELNLP